MSAVAITRLREMGRQTLVPFLCMLLFVPVLHGWQGNPGEVNLQIIVVDSSAEAERLLQQIKNGAPVRQAADTWVNWILQRCGLSCAVP